MWFIRLSPNKYNNKYQHRFSAGKNFPNRCINSPICCTSGLRRFSLSCILALPVLSLPVFTRLFLVPLLSVPFSPVSLLAVFPLAGEDLLKTCQDARKICSQEATLCGRSD